VVFWWFTDVESLLFLFPLFDCWCRLSQELAIESRRRSEGVSTSETQRLRDPQSALGLDRFLASGSRVSAECHR
jgi:hypothetical protein